jgi:hypothetical protein
MTVCSYSEVMVKKINNKSKLRKLLPDKLFSFKTALLFVVLFAGIGAYFLFISFASPGALKPRSTYTWWYWSDYPAQTHTSLEASMTIESDPTKDVYKVGYYWANQFWGPGEGGYMGIQTNGEAGTFRGKVAIFALWGGISAVGQQPDWCYVVNGGFDGDPAASGATCRVPLPWNAGDRYKMRIITTADDASGRTWESYVKNEATGVEQLVGRIKTSKRGLLEGALVNWTEFYSSGRAACDAPYSKVIFHTPTLENGQVPSNHNNQLGSNTDCQDSAITDISGGVRQEQSINQAGISAQPPLPSGGTYISDLNWLSATVGYGPINKDLAASGKPLNINGVTYAKGIGTHADSTITYNLGGRYTRLVSYAGNNIEASGTVTFEVWADEVKLFGSPVMDNSSRPAVIDVDLTGKQQLKLVVTSAGDGITADSADWGDTRIFPYAPPPSIDTTAPSTTITSPANNAIVTNTITVQATATDNIGVSRVELLVDGQLAATDTTSPYSFSLNTTTLSEGVHELRSRAFDAAGNTTASAPVSITVDNIPAPTLCEDPTATNVGQPLPCTYTPSGPKPGDVNGDNQVNIFDLSQLLSNWNRTGATRSNGDLDGNTIVNLFDLSILLSKWGT